MTSALGGGPAQYGNTRFDYSLGNVWDLKWHGAGSADAPLNDMAAINSAVADRGLGFLILTGEVEYDDGAFRQWQRQQRLLSGKRAASRMHPPSYQRRSKTAFRATRLDAYLVPDMEALEGAVGCGALAVLAQGRQASGAPRPPKYRMRLNRARDLLVGSREFQGAHSG